MIITQPAWKHIATIAAEKAFGPDTRTHLTQRRHGGHVAWAIDPLGNTLAIGGGKTEADAWRMLADQVVDYRGSYPDMTDAAQVLGITRSAVKQLMRHGLLNPFVLGNNRNVTRFTPAELARVALTPKRVASAVTIP